jgi:hypothetical protein
MSTWTGSNRMAALRPTRGVLPLGTAVALLALLLAPAHAAPVERDLGDGLAYARVHAAATDLPTDAAVRDHPCILDLRYARGDDSAATVLASWLSSHASPRTPVFVLVNSATADALRNVLARHDPASGVLVVGTAAQTFAPDLAVTQSPESERQAYAAFDAGAPIAALTTDNPTKQRDDEASLSHSRAPEAEDDAAGGAPADRKAGAKGQPPTIDAALQRAIQVYRGLEAMNGKGKTPNANSPNAKE